VSLTPKMTVLDIYQTILTKAGVRIHLNASEKRTSEANAGVEARVKALIPFFGGGEAKGSGEIKSGSLIGRR
jgi:hypothetical protein